MPGQSHGCVVYTVDIVLLISVMVYGRVVNGSRRWFDLGTFHLQPSELMKLHGCRLRQGLPVRRVGAMAPVKRWLRTPRTAIWADVVFRLSLASPSTRERSVACGGPR